MFVTIHGTRQFSEAGQKAFRCSNHALCNLVVVSWGLVMPEGIAMKVETEAERVALRAVIARGIDPGRWKECPCGWFYSGARCPDKNCKEWTRV